MAEDLHKTNYIDLSHADVVEPGDDNSNDNEEEKIEIDQDFVISEDNLCSSFGLKEEIAAQSLILSALSGQVQEGISQLVSSSHGSTTSSQCQLVSSESQEIERTTTNDLSCDSSENYLQDRRTNLSFRVSSEVGGVQLIAIQQAVTGNASSNESTAVNVNLTRSTTYLDGAQHLVQQGGPVVDLHAIETQIKTENEEGESSATDQTSIEEQIVNQLQVDLEAETARHSHSEVEVNNFPDDEIKISIPNTPIASSYNITHPGNEIELLLHNPRNYQLFVASTANESHDIIKRYAEETMSTFVSMRKMKQFGITDGGIDLKKKNYRVFFESCDVEFDGIPYIYVADKMYICHLGKDKTEVTRQKIRQQSMEKRMKMGLPVKDCSASRLRTKKIDCPVKITVKMIAKFPQFQVLRKTKRVCETASKKVRHALTETNGQLRCYYSFVGKLPAVSEHNHPVGEETTVNEPIDPLIKDKIIQLTWEGIQSSNELRKLLDEYVEHELFAGKAPPAKTRRRYYPNVKDIRNYMNKAKMLTRFSPEIRSELETLCQKFQAARPDENFILKSDQLELENSRESLLQIKTCDDEFVPNATLVFCHQTSQQQRLLKRYGNQFVICEVTNLIERMPFPMFCLFVQTNVDYQLAATFIVEVRNKESIVQGLTSLKEWNPGWSPKYVTVDYSDAQMEAVMEIFPGSSQFISDMSRERSWRQWLSKAENEIGGNSDRVFDQFQAIANAYNEEELHNAALQLENSEVWAEAASLRSWFNSNWLLEAKKWVAGYRPDDFFMALHNEMPIDKDVQSLRDAHINCMRGKKLTSLIDKLVEKIIPEFYRRYVELNRKSYVQANELKVLYGDQLPACLINKPASVIMYVLNQIKSTEATVYQVSHVQPGVFWVQDASTSTSQTQQAHTVSFGDAVNLPSCDCIDWQRYKLPCKHLCSVFSSFSDWGWDMLNTTYTSNSIINLDYSCIKPWIQVQEKENERTKNSINLNKISESPAEDDVDCSETITASSNIESAGVSMTCEEETSTEIDSIESECDIRTHALSTEEINAHSNNEVFILNVNTDDIPMLTDDRRNEIAIQCHNLLQNLSQLSPNLVTDESLERLKSDLQASIGVLKMEPDTKQFTSVSDMSTSTEETVVSQAENFVSETDRNLEVAKRTTCMDYNEGNVKRRKCGHASSIESFASTSIVSDEEESTALINEGGNMEDQTVETVEIVTENENIDLDTSCQVVGDNLRISCPERTINIVSRECNNSELTREQRERQLLAILTASTT